MMMIKIMITNHDHDDGVQDSCTAPYAVRSGINTQIATGDDANRSYFYYVFSW